jgi:C2 domain
MSKDPAFAYDEEDDDDSYDANWSPGMEQAPAPVRPPPGVVNDDSIRSSQAKYSQQQQQSNAVSFSLDNIAAGQDGYSQRPAYANAYNRDTNPLPSKGGRDEEADAKRSKAAAAKSTKVVAPVDNKKHRVRPYRCFTEPTYMTEDEIYEDMMKPSKTAAFLKSHFPPSTSKIPGEFFLSDMVRSLYDSPEVDGRIGSIRVEVLGAVGLARQKPYCAVYVVSGDCAFCTDVLNNFRSPMWPSASTRAAVFPVHHAYARVFVGLFDVKKRQNKDNDVFLGRVVIDVAQLRPNTEYDITFPLRASSFVYDRRKRGVIRLRFSLHWFSERAAICSYLKSSRWFSASEPTRGLGQPTIPCAEPKTFRNIAVTCHGQDFPGKYTRMAFRATMREFNLYHINLRFVMKTLTLDALLYERPHISLYLFLAYQHCIYSNVVRMVPPYFSGYLILLFLDNYRHFNVSNKFTLGYKPLTVQEILMGLIRDGKSDTPNFKPIEIKKRAKKKVSKKSDKAKEPDNSYFGSFTTFGSLMGMGEEEEKMEEGIEIEPRDHREFPFSERDEYPKFAVQEALAPSTKAPVKGKVPKWTVRCCWSPSSCSNLPSRTFFVCMTR